MRAWPTPSEAISHGACAICLGSGITFQVDLGELAPCTGCGGSGVLNDMLARNCNDPNCPDHHGPPQDFQYIPPPDRHLHLVPAIDAPPVCPGCGAVAEMVGSFWETAHLIDCTWMQDPDSEPY